VEVNLGAPDGKSKVANIEIKAARAVFGERAFNPDRPVVVVWAENGARLPLMVPLGVKYMDGRWVVFNQRAYSQSVSYEKSKFGAFVRKYGGMPVVGLLVETQVDDRGFLVICT
jgi:hypothetical protein